MGAPPFVQVQVFFNRLLYVLFHDVLAHVLPARFPAYENCIYDSTDANRAAFQTLFDALSVPSSESKAEAQAEAEAGARDALVVARWLHMQLELIEHTGASCSTHDLFAQMQLDLGSALLPPLEKPIMRALSSCLDKFIEDVEIVPSS